MKNFQKLAMGMLVAVLAIGFSAFRASENVASVTFYQLSPDNYTKITNPEGFCDPNQVVDHGCKIIYANDPGVSSFNYSSRPPGGTESGGNRLWN